MKQVRSFLSTASSHDGIVDLWGYRFLILQLIARDLSVRYRRTLLGWLWAVLNPGLNLAMLYCVFGVMLGFGRADNNVPYALVLLSGLILWGLFSSIINAVSDSLLNNIHLIKKIYFPRSALTIALLGVSIVDFVISLLMLLLVLFFSAGENVKINLLLMFVSVSSVIAMAWGIGSIIAIVKLRFRDVRHLLPFVLQALFYATPVVWTPSLLPGKIHLLEYINPLCVVFSIFRYSIFGGSDAPAMFPMVFSSCVCLLISGFGFFFFSFNEAKVVDLE